MARINRKAFTLVEMLVVIVIIGMLVAMLVPAVISARESARRASCLNRMSELGKAIAQYESAKKELPGYVNRMGGDKLGAFAAGGSKSDMSWVVMTFQYIGRADLWEKWSSDPLEVEKVALSETVCASDTERRGQAAALSFVANCGISDVSSDVTEYTTLEPNAYKTSATGLFFDQDTTNGLPAGLTKPVTIAIDEIKDGSQQTILLSENVAAISWKRGGPSTQRAVGMVWWSAEPSLTWAAVVPTQVHINSEDTLISADKFKTRPSSFHPAGVNVVYADGHADFVSDRIDYSVFRDQMISNQTEVENLGLIP